MCYLPIIVNATIGHSHVPFFFFLCTAVSTQVGFPASLHSTPHAYSHKYPPTETHTHTHTHKHTCSSNYVSRIIQKEATSSCSAVQRGCPPPVKHDKRAMLRPDRAIWAVTLQPAIPHREYIDTQQAVGQSDTHKMEIVTCTGAHGASLKLWEARFLCENIPVPHLISQTCGIIFSSQDNPPINRIYKLKLNIN